jgi:hypothetical protein
MSKGRQIEILLKKLALEEYSYMIAVEEGECFYTLKQIEGKIIKLKVIVECLIKISTGEQWYVLSKINKTTVELRLQDFALV